VSNIPAGVIRGISFHPKRADLDADALKVVSTWLFDPGTCHGTAQGYTIDSVVHFQRS